MRKDTKKAIWASLAAALFATAFLGMGCNVNKSRFEKYDEASRYSVGNFTYSAHTITNVEIDWVSGTVEVAQSDSPTLSVEEKDPSPVDEQKMHYYIDSDTLHIKYCKSGLKLNFDEDFKDLRVEIPAGIELDISSIDAAVTVQAVSLREFSAETVGGKIVAENVSADEISMEGVGGSLTLGIAKAKTDVALETVGGNIKLTLLNGLGAKIEFATLGGKFKTEKKYGKSGRRYDVYGADGVSTDCHVEVDTVGGDLTVY
ncbi:MAG: DUF4097 family beta strand repeat protein [Clostridia bacterium]|nr:DUF4097 family beta strand repeat protein [Clostridia bacterium]